MSFLFIDDLCVTGPYIIHTHTAFALCSSYMDSACSTPAVSYLLYATNLCVDLTLDV
jgi:hypothetical protein